MKKNPFSKKSDDATEATGAPEASGDDVPKKSALSASMKKTLIAVGAASVLAISGVLLLVSYVKGAEESATVIDTVPTETIVVVEAPIKAGTTLDDLSGENFVRFKEQETPIDLIPPGAIGSIQELSGMGDVMTDVNLSVGEPLLGVRLVPTEQFSTRSLVVDVPADHHQASFRISPERVLGGLIRPGDNISMSAAFESSEGFPRLTAVVLPSIEVINVQIEGEAQAPIADEEAIEEGPASRDALGSAPTSEFLVTVAVTADELVKLHYAVDYGSILVAAATDEPPQNVAAVQTLETILEAAGAQLDREDGTLSIDASNVALSSAGDAPSQLAFDEDENADDSSAESTGDEGDDSDASAEEDSSEGRSLRSPSEAFSTDSSGG